MMLNMTKVQKIIVSRDYNNAINDSLSNFDFSQEAINYYSDNEIEEEVVDNFKDSKTKS